MIEGRTAKDEFAMVKSRIAEKLWRTEQPLYQNDKTGLPVTLGPFWITQKNDGWAVTDSDGKPLHVAADYFDAFRMMLDAYERWWRRNCDPFVYFIGTTGEKTSLVKIGYALHVPTRLAGIQTGNPHPLKVLATVRGGKGLERQYHRRFARQRRHGEWFVIDGPIHREITRLCALQTTDASTPSEPAVRWG